MRRLLMLLALGQVDRPFGQVGVEVLALLPRQLDDLKRGCDLVIGEKPLLKAIRDEPPQFFSDGRTRFRPQFGAEKPCALCAFDLPLRDNEPGIRGLRHRNQTTSLLLRSHPVLPCTDRPIPSARTPRLPMADERSDA